MSSKEEIVLVSAVRTPFGRFGGSLRDIDCFDLSATVMQEAVKRAGVEGKDIDEVYWGVGDTVSSKDVYTPVTARQALLKAGLPPETPSCSFDKACVSGISAVQMGCRAIWSGEADTILTGGITTFSRIPFLLRNTRWEGHRMGPITMEDPLFELGYKDYNPVAVDAGEVSVEHGISREEQDYWAAQSHKRYGEAHGAGAFKEEMQPLEIERAEGREKKQFTLDIDEQYRPNVTPEKLQKLPLIYGSPTVTAGNAPGLNDGAAAAIIMSRRKAESLGLKPLATIVSIVSTALAPRLLAEGPAKAAQMALERAALGLDDIKRLEINEAFAAVTLVSAKILADGDRSKLEKIQARLNVNGGAIAIGHANTCSGSRILMHLVYELKRLGGGYGLAAICGGLAQADACIIKVE